MPNGNLNELVAEKLEAAADQPTAELRNPGKPTNRLAAILGIGLFTSAFAVLYLDGIVHQVGVTFPVLIACVGLGLILFAVGDEARLVGTGFNIAGASAISLAIFFTWNDASTKREKVYRGVLRVDRSNAAEAVAAQKGQKRFLPRSATLVYQTKAINGRANFLTDQHFQFVFEVSPSGIVDLFTSTCQEISIYFDDGSSVSRSFSLYNVDASNYELLFDLLYQVDVGRIYFNKNKNTKPLADCGDHVSQEKEVIQTTVKAETNIKAAQAPSTLPSAGLPRPNSTTQQKSVTAMEAVSFQKPPSEPPKDPPSLKKDLGQVVGYVVFSQLNAASEPVKRWFDIEGKPDAKFPVPNDILVATRDKVAVRPTPYHWDDAQQRHVPPSSVVANVPSGKKAKVASDAIVAFDENNNSHYVIVPVSQVLDSPLPQVPVFLPEQAGKSIIGYTYIGSISKSMEYSEKIFDNQTRPAAIYPAPNDILVARSDVWLRSGPRYWDQSKQEYVNSQPVKPIKQGQYVRVSGDTVLARGGLSIWTPIDIIFGGLEELASVQKP